MHFNSITSTKIFYSVEEEENDNNISGVGKKWINERSRTSFADEYEKWKITELFLPLTLYSFGKQNCWRFGFGEGEEIGDRENGGACMYVGKKKQWDEGGKPPKTTSTPPIL